MQNLKPKRLKKGDTVGIIAPASPLFKKSDLKRGIKTLEEWGYNVVVGDHVNCRHEYIAGTDEQRAADFNAMFANDNVDAVFVTQGGYGSARMIDRIDFDLVRKNPKIFIGYSDITSLHLAIQKHTGLVTFHGPGMAGFNSEDLTAYREEYLDKALCSSEPIGEIKMADDKKYLDVINEGQVRGELVGGNLTLVCASLGTPFEIDTKDKILFLEEVWTEPWILDHMFTHLKNAGKLQEAAGIVIGECSECEPRKLDPGFPVTFFLEDILEDFLKPLDIPVIHGLPIGHTKDLATLPIGVSAYLDATNGKLFVEESGTED
ncbi:S66 peptidase family protein [Thalassobacillus hwangdonensis]|uniref:LD-carboxypeptidase n=1 Tax=Thalassobacillus hwangdonensis TaxID=546108 RepID=A0ABW3L541_9BACI